MGGGHLGFFSLAELAHIFTRSCIAYFVKNFFLNQNQFSKIESEKVVTDSIGFASTNIIDYFESNNMTMATFLDLSKAFDTIDHSDSILIKKT